MWRLAHVDERRISELPSFAVSVIMLRYRGTSHTECACLLRHKDKIRNRSLRAGHWAVSGGVPRVNLARAPVTGRPRALPRSKAASPRATTPRWIRRLAAANPEYALFSDTGMTSEWEPSCSALAVGGGIPLRQPGAYRSQPVSHPVES